VTKRESLTKKTRFEVFKRDSFTCQYCGRKAPDILLQVDHIEPVAKGGANDLLNLITSCFDCNSGKSDRKLSDTSVIDKQRQQLEYLQERKEQIEMMFQWQKGMLDIDDEVATQLGEYWAEQIPGFSLNESGLKGLKRLKRRFEISEIMEAMKVAAEQYVKYEDGKPTHESVELAWKRVGGICSTRRQEKDNPELSRIYYIRGILRNRLRYCNEGMALQLLKEAIALGASVESLESHSKEVSNWSRWRSEIEDFILSHEKTEEDEAKENQG
jgi:hypothetical protein